MEGNALKITTQKAGMYICIVYGDRCDPDALADYNAHGGASMEYELEFEKEQSSHE